jgi:hypothetical protein
MGTVSIKDRISIMIHSEMKRLAHLCDINMKPLEIKENVRNADGRILSYVSLILDDDCSGLDPTIYHVSELPRDVKYLISTDSMYHYKSELRKHHLRVDMAIYIPIRDHNRENKLRGIRVPSNT